MGGAIPFFSKHVRCITIKPNQNKEGRYSRVPRLLDTRYSAKAMRNWNATYPRFGVPQAYAVCGRKSGHG